MLEGVRGGKRGNVLSSLTTAPVERLMVRNGELTPDRSLARCGSNKK